MERIEDRIPKWDLCPLCKTFLASKVLRDINMVTTVYYCPNCYFEILYTINLKQLEKVRRAKNEEDRKDSRKNS